MEWHKKPIIGCINDRKPRTIFGACTIRTTTLNAYMHIAHTTKVHNATQWRHRSVEMTMKPLDFNCHTSYWHLFKKYFLVCPLTAAFYVRHSRRKIMEDKFTEAPTVLDLVDKLWIVLKICSIKWEKKRNYVSWCIAYWDSGGPHQIRAPSDNHDNTSRSFTVWCVLCCVPVLVWVCLICQCLFMHRPMNVKPFTKLRKEIMSRQKDILFALEVDFFFLSLALSVMTPKM